MALSSVALGAEFETKVYDLPNASYIHDISPAPDGAVWYTAQRDGQLGILDPKTEKFKGVPGSKPDFNVRQILGWPGQILLPESGTSRIMIVRTDTAALTN